MNLKKSADGISTKKNRPFRILEEKELQLMGRASGEFAKKQLAPHREENDRYPYGPFFSNAVEKAFKNAEMILAQANRMADSHLPGWETYVQAAALHIQELACDVTTAGIQVLGGVGYMKDFGQEKRFRDARHIQALLGSPPVKKIKFLDPLIQ